MDVTQESPGSRENEAASQPTPNPTGKTFDLARVYHLLDKALVVEESCKSIDLKCYCDAWRELVKFLDTLGTLFHFVTHDVRQKLTTIEQFMTADPTHYRTINSALEYEVENSLTNTKKPSGSRTIQRIHRALDYLLAFFEKLVDAPPEAKCSALSSEAYSQTLSRYHAWLVRKAASLAMYSLPTRNVLLERIDPHAGNEERVTHLLADIIRAGRPLHQLTAEIYGQHGVGDLP